MNMVFAEKLKKLRTERGLSQRELAEQLFVSRAAVTRWENGSRLPDALMISRLSKCLGVDVSFLLGDAAESEGELNVIMVDDRKIVLSGSLPIVEKVMPNASVTGFTRPSEAIGYARSTRISLALLDIEIGQTSGMDLCRTLLEINPCTNVVFLTAYVGYSFDAWSTGACGFLLKPITEQSLREALGNLRYPILSGGEGK